MAEKIDFRAVADQFGTRSHERAMREDPVLWAQDRLGDHLWSKQREVMYSLRDNKRTLVASCHASGKGAPPEAEILTSRGWITYGELERGDQVYTPGEAHTGSRGHEVARSPALQGGVQRRRHRAVRCSPRVEHHTPVAPTSEGLRLAGALGSDTPVRDSGDRGHSPIGDRAVELSSAHLPPSVGLRGGSGR